MKYHNKIVVLAAFLVGVSVSFPQSVAAETTEASAMSEAEKAILIASLLEQIAQLTALLETMQAQEAEQVTAEQSVEIADDKPLIAVSTGKLDSADKEFGSDDDYYAEYAVRKGAEIDLVKGEAEEFDQGIWDIFINVAGTDLVYERIDRFSVYDSSDASSASYLTVLGAQEPNWRLSFNTNDIDLDDADSYESVIETAVHEYAHVLSLNTDQVWYNEGRGGCDAYVHIGCAQKGSYLHDYITTFWDDEALSFSESVSVVSKYKYFIKKLNDYYDDYPDHFVSSYSASDPTEDFAEAFTYFVFDGTAPSGSVLQQKLDFFSEYPDLVEEKGKIKSAVLALLEERE